MESFTRRHAALLYTRFSAIYGDKFVKPYHDDNFRTMWYEDWEQGLSGIDINLIKYALSHCRLNLEWPPSIAEFRKICEQASGVPSESACLAAAIRGDFSHPITAMAYDKVGSWDMKNAKEADLLPKFNIAYVESLNQFRANPESVKARFEQYDGRQFIPYLVDSKEQMACEAKHIAQNEIEKRSRMPESLRAMVAKMKEVPT